MPSPSSKIVKHLNATGTQAYVLQKFYCSPMEKLGKCTKLCNSCQPILVKIFLRVRSYENPKNSDAILTYEVREELARIEDESEAPQTFPTTWLGEIDQRNPFELLAEIVA